MVWRHASQALALVWLSVCRVLTLHVIKDNSEGGSCVTPLTAHSPGSLDGNALFIEDTSTRIEALHIQMCLSLLEAYPMFLHCQDFNEDEDVSVLEYCQVPQGERPWVLCMEEKKVVVTGA